MAENEQIVQTREPTLLMISDIEGCLKLRNGRIEQNMVLCEPGTYIENGPLYKFLTNNDKNKIAFLGDYFDKGNGVIDSINGIVGLKKNFGDRVHIILGNRDINKFRFAYEVDVNRAENMDSSMIWSVWKNFYNPYSETFTPDNLDNRINIILKESMGADVITSTNNVHKIISVFNNKEENDGFVQNCRYLYHNAKIITYDTDFKVLLSHGGGYNKDLFDKQIYSTYARCYNESEKGKNYFNKIEMIRKELQKPLTLTYEKYSNIDTLTIQINTPLEDFLKIFYKMEGEQYLINTENKEPPKEHYLLQALGLKPDTGDHKFLSFIQSCGQNSCSGIRDSIVSNPSDKEELSDILDEYGIRNVAHGHVPHCIPQPLIYYRLGKPNINNDAGYKQSKVIFIANDTSNGNRSGGTTLDELPLSYIKTRGDTFAYGVSSVTNDGKLSDTKTYKGDSDANDKIMFNEFVKEFKYEDVKSDVEVNNMIDWNKPTFFNATIKRKATTGGKTRRNRLTKSKNLKKANRRSRKPNKRSIKKSTCGCQH